MKKPATKKAKAAKPVKEAKPEKAKKPKKVSHAQIQADPDLRALFLNTVKKYKPLIEAKNKAARGLQAFGKIVKADGFTMAMLKDAVLCETPEGEAQIRSEISNRMLAAKYVGAALGTQLDMFMEPDRTPAVDVAWDEGVMDSMAGKTANPSKYDPSTPQHAKYLEGFHAETERRVKSGITKPEEDDGKPGLITRAQKAAADKAEAAHKAKQDAANKPVVPSPRINEPMKTGSSARAAAEKLFN